MTEYLTQCLCGHQKEDHPEAWTGLWKEDDEGNLVQVLYRPCKVKGCRCQNFSHQPVDTRKVPGRSAQPVAQSPVLTYPQMKERMQDAEEKLAALREENEKLKRELAGVVEIKRKRA